MPGPLQHRPSRILGELLVLNGFGTDPEDTPDSEWPVFCDREPDDPDEIIKVSGTAGTGHGDCQVDSERQEHHGIQVMVRAADDGAAFRKINAVAMFLDRVNRILVDLDDEVGTATGSTRYQVTAITRTSDPTYIGRDAPQGKRSLYTYNALCSLRMCE